MNVIGSIIKNNYKRLDDPEDFNLANSLMSKLYRDIYFKENIRTLSQDDFIKLILRLNSILCSEYYHLQWMQERSRQTNFDETIVEKYFNENLKHGGFLKI